MKDIKLHTCCFFGHRKIDETEEFKKAIEAGIDEKMMADWLVEFFGIKDTASVSEEYNVACTGGSAKNANIVARHEALADSYDEFFKSDENDIESEDEDDDITTDELEELDELDEFDELDESDETDETDDHESFVNDVMSYVQLAQDE